MQFFAALARPRGQGGIEIWVSSSKLKQTKQGIVLHNDHRLLLIKVELICGTVQVAAAHALDSSDSKEQVQYWWRMFEQPIKGLFSPKVPTIWRIDVDASVGSSLSCAVGPRQLGVESFSGALFHDVVKQV